MTTVAPERAANTRSKHRPLTREEMFEKNHQIRKRCMMPKPDGTTGLVSVAHISRIFNPNKPHTPSPDLARKIAAALTEILEREVTMDMLYDYLENVLGKSLGWPKKKNQ